MRLYLGLAGQAWCLGDLGTAPFLHLDLCLDDLTVVLCDLPVALQGLLWSLGLTIHRCQHRRPNGAALGNVLGSYAVW